MAAPGLDNGIITGTDATGAWSFTGAIAQSAAGHVIIVCILQDGSTAGAVTLGTCANVEDLAGTDNTLTAIGEFAVGGSSEARMYLWIGRTLVTSPTTITIAGANTTSEDVYFFVRAWASASTGTTLATVIENATAGSTGTAAGTSGTISDAAVQTLGPDRVALNFVAINDDNTITTFTGQSGGTWALAGDYIEASGTDGAISMHSANMATAGTIDGGTTTNPDALDAWGVVGFALIGTTVAATRVPFTSPYPQLLAQ